MIAPTILDRLLEPVADILSPEAAQRLVDLRLDPSMQQRLDELAEKANRGELSNEEREEYEQYIDGIDVLAVLKTKARSAIRRSSP
jgi:hypothetical protein